MRANTKQSLESWQAPITPSSITSSIWVSETMGEKNFHWQDGYSVFTVSASAKEDVQRYISHQEEYHRKRSFREELIDFLKKSGVEFEEKYLD